jgi:hypothetical protein
MSYCTASDVGVLLGLTYSATSLPTQSQVESIIEQVTAEIDINLRTIGVTSVTDAKTLLYLKMVCAKGSACYVGSVYFNNIQSVGGTISNTYCTMYKDELKKIIDNPEMIGADGGSISVGSNVTTMDEVEDLFIEDRFTY